MESWLTFLEPQKLIIALGVLFAFGILFWVLKRIITSDEDEGKQINAKLYKKRVLLIEVGLITLLVGEVFLGTSLVDEALFWSRLIQLSVIAMFGVISGLSIAPQWKEALDITFNMSGFKLLSKSDRVKANTMIFIQWAGALIFTGLALIAPLIMLWFVASGLDEAENLLPANWMYASDALIATMVFAVLHVLVIFMIGIVSMDKILDINQEILIEKVQNKSKRIQMDWANVTQYIKKHFNMERTALEALINIDPSKKISMEGKIIRMVSEAADYAKIRTDVSLPDKDREEADKKIQDIHTELRSILVVPVSTT